MEFGGGGGGRRADGCYNGGRRRNFNFYIVEIQRNRTGVTSHCALVTCLQVGATPPSNMETSGLPPPLTFRLTN